MLDWRFLQQNDVSPLSPRTEMKSGGGKCVAFIFYTAAVQRQYGANHKAKLTYGKPYGVFRKCMLEASTPHMLYLETKLCFILCRIIHTAVQTVLH
jgi:hypothetical protein